MEVKKRLAAAFADRYTIEREIGRGGMATVYLARDLKHDRRVAVKVLDPDLAQTLGAERFLREIRTVANLSHPHILPLFDSGEADGFLFYVMPYVKGESLRTRLTKEKQLPVEDAIQITREIADALAHAHDEGVIHRDVKPANIMLEAGHAVLADFGVAHAVAEAKDQRLTRTGTSLGTPAYMSPEQAMGEEDLDGRSDQYALGCVLFEMLAGHPPFTGAQVEAVVRQHLTEEPPSVTKTRPSVADEVVGVIERSLAKSPADRFRSTGEMAAALALTTAPAPVPARSGLGRAKALIYGGTVALGLATIAVIASVWTGADLDEGLVAVLPFENRTGDASLDVLGTMAADRITEGIAGSDMLSAGIETVPSQQVLSVQASQEGIASTSSAAGPLQTLAETTGAGTVISGWYYTEDESLLFQAEIHFLDSEPAVESVRIREHAENRTAALDELRERVLGALAVSGGERAGAVPFGRFRPFPRHSAILLWRTGNGAFGAMNFGEAIAGYDRALEIDSTFAWARLRAAVAYQNLGEFAASDSVLGLLEPQRDQLSRHNRLWLDLRRAQINNDLLAEFEGSRALLEADDSDMTVRYNVGLYALELNRPREAIEVLLPLAERGGSWYNTWDVLTQSYHFLGDHGAELDAARRGRKFYPSELEALQDEVEALAAQGRGEEVNRLLDEALMFSEGSPGRVMLSAAEELRAHGHLEEARRVLERALGWLGGRPSAEMETEEHRYGLAEVLYVAEEWDEAGAVFHQLYAENPDSVSYHGYLGALAARRGDRDEALAVSQELAEIHDPYGWGENHFWRARIAAILGENERAVDLLREAHGKGRPFWIDIHRSIDLESLRGYEPFENFMEPKG
jgi:tRNA A-37 threonylcarbamoyl transferase component Bud32/tetratricopeptide (TPR) repeat protein